MYQNIYFHAQWGTTNSEVLQYVFRPHKAIQNKYKDSKLAFLFGSQGSLCTQEGMHVISATKSYSF